MGTIGALPQGAPTSPMLSNLVMRKFDEALEEYANTRGLCVTRYADDIVFSTADQAFTRADAAQVTVDVAATLRRFGLLVNAVKTKIVPPGARKVVLGLVVDADRPTLSKEFKRSLETHLHAIEKFSPRSHCAARKFDSVYGMRRYLFGLVAYATQIDEHFGRRCAERMRDIAW